MRKYISLLLAVIMLQLCAAAPVKAEYDEAGYTLHSVERKEGAVSVVLDKSNLSSGDTVNVKVNVTTNFTAAAASVVLKYDTGAMTLQSVKKGSIDVEEYGKGLIRGARQAFSDTSFKGTLFSADFKVNDNVNPSDAEFEIVQYQFTTSNAVMIVPSITNATAKVNGGAPAPTEKPTAKPSSGGDSGGGGDNSTPKPTAAATPTEMPTLAPTATPYPTPKVSNSDSDVVSVEFDRNSGYVTLTAKVKDDTELSSLDKIITSAYTGDGQLISADIWSGDARSFSRRLSVPEGMYIGEIRTAVTQTDIFATAKPTEAPTPSPTTEPTEAPTPSPTTEPTEAPTPSPTTEPTGTPAASPEITPSQSPEEAVPTPTTGTTEEITPTPTTAVDENTTPTPTTEATEEINPTPTTDTTEEINPTPTTDTSENVTPNRDDETENTKDSSDGDDNGDMDNAAELNSFYLRQGLSLFDEGDEDEGGTEASPSPETTPSASPEVTPTASPETTPSASPEVTPTASPETTPSASPEVTPTASPETTPSASPEVTPTTTPVLDMAYSLNVAFTRNEGNDIEDGYYARAVLTVTDELRDMPDDVIIALYDENGKLIRLNVSNIAVTAIGNTAEWSTYILPVLDDDVELSGIRIKAFIWDSSGKLTPLAVNASEIIE